MFERVLEFFKERPVGARERGKFSEDDPRLAAAALLFHIMDVDGETRESERKKLAATLSGKYGLKGEALKRLIRAAEAADQQAIDLSDFTAVLKRHLDYAARVDFMALMWDIVYADGEAREVETDVMWRVAQLIGLSEEDRNAVQARAEQASRGAPA